MNCIKRKTTTTKSKYSAVDFAYNSKAQFLVDVVNTVEMEGILVELILNWDQNGMKIVPSSSWTIDNQGLKRV